MIGRQLPNKDLEQGHSRPWVSFIRVHLAPQTGALVPQESREALPASLSLCSALNDQWGVWVRLVHPAERCTEQTEPTVNQVANSHAPKIPLEKNRK